MFRIFYDRGVSLSNCDGIGILYDRDNVKSKLEMIVPSFDLVFIHDVVKS